MKLSELLKLQTFWNPDFSQGKRNIYNNKFIILQKKKVKKASIISLHKFYKRKKWKKWIQLWDNLFYKRKFIILSIIIIKIPNNFPNFFCPVNWHHIKSAKQSSPEQGSTEWREEGEERARRPERWCANTYSQTLYTHGRQAALGNVKHFQNNSGI